MDRTYTSYHAGVAALELAVRPSQAKSYSTLYVNEDGRDVMILHKGADGAYGTTLHGPDGGGGSDGSTARHAPCRAVPCRRGRWHGP